MKTKEKKIHNPFTPIDSKISRGAFGMIRIETAKGCVHANPNGFFSKSGGKLTNKEAKKTLGLNWIY
jgi:hypothetical protein